MWISRFWYLHSCQLGIIIILDCFVAADLRNIGYLSYVVCLIPLSRELKWISRHRHNCLERHCNRESFHSYKFPAVRSIVLYSMAKEFTTLINPFFLFRESLQLAFNEYHQHTQGNHESPNPRPKPDAKKLSKIVSRQWRKQPAPVRKGWKRQAERNKLRRDSRKTRHNDEISAFPVESDSDPSESDLDCSSSECTDEDLEQEWNKKGVVFGSLSFQFH